MKHSLSIECTATRGGMFLRQAIGTGALPGGEKVQFDHHLGGGFLVTISGRQYSVTLDQILQAVIALDETSPVLTDLASGKKA
jgi:hypothetical protein